MHALGSSDGKYEYGRKGNAMLFSEYVIMKPYV